MVENYLREIFLLIVAVLTIVGLIICFKRIYDKDNEDTMQLQKIKDIHTDKRIKKSNDRRKIK